MTEEILRRPIIWWRLRKRNALKNNASTVVKALRRAKSERANREERKLP
jgi:hypothetical protein